MWLKFVKGLSLKEKCKFSTIENVSFAMKNVAL